MTATQPSSRVFRANHPEVKPFCDCITIAEEVQVETFTVHSRVRGFTVSLW